MIALLRLDDSHRQVYQKDTDIFYKYKYITYIIYMCVCVCVCVCVCSAKLHILAIAIIETTQPPLLNKETGLNPKSKILKII